MILRDTERVEENKMDFLDIELILAIFWKMENKEHY